MPQQTDIPSIPEVSEGNKQQHMPLPQTNSHILVTTARTDNTTLIASITNCSRKAQFSQPIESSQLSKKNIPQSGAFSNRGDERCNDRNCITVHDTPILPQHLFSPTSQMQTPSHHNRTETNKNISTAVLPLALLSPNQSFIRITAARHSNESEMEQHSIEDEALDRIRKNLTQLGVELQENTRQQIRFIGEAEWVDIKHDG
ncbi:hypothetical protein FOXG_19611 [Fusarium oxysporum f. sp. lycopersici 4287]|uniref:Uncharacterized protein n=1 Tax=Fusarium oxysporum f. sp. lycopersici (strain 4287 / CBS 123668 / FGSC 9935 / NRRL 34936) TaxID=426428 RepID=A0A0J9V4T8_FUSO4|nr:hypothetical protein FOXG_19611 [Fusarium oxysporum f. sp. lycopersici 4287]KAJ9419693.1 hypothetical protein QL093DRAFT_2371740 [Fusarium oxysporum]KNB06250.1 hypothetical protein FOXG_19611 [Fusarium oxysporum f. sp. lycopersici 4287]